MRDSSVYSWMKRDRCSLVACRSASSTFSTTGRPSSSRTARYTSRHPAGADLAREAVALQAQRRVAGAELVVLEGGQLAAQRALHGARGDFGIDLHRLPDFRAALGQRRPCRGAGPPRWCPGPRSRRRPPSRRGRAPPARSSRPSARPRPRRAARRRWPPPSSPVPCWRTAGARRCSRCRRSAWSPCCCDGAQAADRHLAGMQADADGERRQPALARSAAPARRGIRGWPAPSPAPPKRRGATAGSGGRAGVSANTAISPSPMNFRCAPAVVAAPARRCARSNAVSSSATSLEPSFSASEVKLRMSENSTVASSTWSAHGALGRLQPELVRQRGRRRGFR